MAHTDEKCCLTVVAFLVRDGKVLLADHPKYDTWLPVGGHIDPGEDPDEALYREIKEETNLDPEDVCILSEADTPPEEPEYKRVSLLRPYFMDRHNIGDRDHVAFVYFGEIVNDKDTLVSHEHKELGWFTEEELKQNDSIKPDITWYALQALNVAGTQQ